MDGIAKLDFVLPEFQREYVWTREQAKQLLVSLLRGYPTGSVLFWKTDDPPEIKNNAVARDRIGTTSVILDGQQRLTTLYLFTRNEIPPYYRAEDIKDDPRNLYFDLDSGEFLYYTRQLMHGNPTWVQVVTCFDGTKIDVFKMAQTKVADGTDPFELAQRFNDRLTAVRNVLVHDYPVQTVPSSATITDAIDVFDRVNSQGTKLSDAELALAHVTGTWPQARRRLKAKSDELSKLHFNFDLTFMARGLNAVVRERALFETLHGAEREELEAGAERLFKLLDYLVTILPRWAFIHSTEDLNSTNVLIPALAYLNRHGGSFRGERELREFTHWLYAASVWARYTSQTDQRLDHDLSAIVRNETPWKQLVDAIIDQRGRIDVKPADLEGRGTQHPLYRMAYVLAKANGGIDWFNGIPLDVRKGTSYALHSHHIFPQALLYRSGYDSENHVHKQIVNEIANRAFLSGPTNQGLSDRAPSDYLPEIESRYPGALQKQFIPLDRSLWELDRFEDFLQARRIKIAEAFSAHMTALLAEVQAAPAPSVSELIATGEGPTLEFKASLRWDIEKRTVNKELQKQCSKTIAAMLNSEGGTLLIGVADDGTVLGLDEDLASIKRGDLDGFAQTVAAILSDQVGAEFAGHVHVTFPQVDGTTIAQVTVDASPKPAFHKGALGAEFYVRVGNTTRQLDPEATWEYIGMHWQA
jgi:hypothetical protein